MCNFFISAIIQSDEKLHLITEQFWNKCRTLGKVTLNCDKDNVQFQNICNIIAETLKKKI